MCYFLSTLSREDLILITYGSETSRRFTNMQVLFYPLLTLLLISGVAHAQSVSASTLESVVTSQFESTKCPGISVAVASKNTVIFSKALGMADLEQHVPMKTDSVQRLASLSKPITGTIIMGLVEQGRLALDASVRQYLPELPTAYEKVTVRYLLDHQSGVQGFTNPAEAAFSMTHYATARDAMRAFMNSPLSFEPGTKTEYSSFAFTILGAAAEAVTGKSFQQLSEDFFRQHAIRGFFLDDPLAIVPGRVRGYLVDPNSTVTFANGQVMTRKYLAGETAAITNARAYDISNRYPAGGFDASAENLLRFVIAVASGKVLKPEIVSKMWTSQNTSDGKKGVFGLGWGVSQWRGHPMVGMNGAEPSTTAFLRYFPQSGVGVALVCNAEGARNLSKLLDDILQATVQ
jgi:serine beta-lactamase-like protein LACTB